MDCLLDNLRGCCGFVVNRNGQKDCAAAGVDRDDYCTPCEAAARLSVRWTDVSARLASAEALVATQQAEIERLTKRKRGVAERFERHIGPLVAVAKEHGYALGVHGSLERDIDLIAAPWTEQASEPAALIEAMRLAVDGYIRNDPHHDKYDETATNPIQRPHGRLAWSIYPATGVTYFDVSVLPRVPADALVEQMKEERDTERTMHAAWRKRAEEAEAHADELRGFIRHREDCAVQDGRFRSGFHDERCSPNCQVHRVYTGPVIVPALLAEVERLKAENARLNEAIQQTAREFHAAINEPMYAGTRQDWIDRAYHAENAFASLRSALGTVEQEIRTLADRIGSKRLHRLAGRLAVLHAGSPRVEETTTEEEQGTRVVEPK